VHETNGEAPPIGEYHLRMNKIQQITAITLPGNVLKIFTSFTYQGDFSEF
jgi:hypothetical protein